MRPRTRLDFEVHGNVAEGNGGRGKISRQRPESAGSPNWAAPPEASKPLALSYIPEILESMATMCSGAERRSLGGLAPVTPETNSHETPAIIFIIFCKIFENIVNYCKLSLKYARNARNYARFYNNLHSFCNILHFFFARSFNEVGKTGKEERKSKNENTRLRR